MSQLSKTQQDILKCIQERVAERGCPPTFREIMAATGLKSLGSIHENLNQLEEKGWIRRDPRSPRSIQILKESSTRILQGKAKLHDPTREQVLEGLLRRGVELVMFVRTRAELEVWGAEVQAVVPEARAVLGPA